MNTRIREVLCWQAVVGLAGSIAVATGLGAVLMLSLAYGVLLTMLNSFLLARRVQRAGEADKKSGQLLLYAGAVSRFSGVLAALLLAYGLGLHLLAVAGGMFLAQIALIAYAARHAGSDEKTGLSINRE